MPEVRWFWHEDSEGCATSLRSIRVAMLGGMQIDCEVSYLVVSRLAFHWVLTLSGIRSVYPQTQDIFFAFSKSTCSLPSLTILENESPREREGLPNDSTFWSSRDFSCLFLASTGGRRRLFFVRVCVCFTKERSRYNRVKDFLSGYRENAIRFGTNRRT